MHPPADQRRAQGGERAVAGRPAGHVPRPQGDEGRPGKNTDMAGGEIEIVGEVNQM